MNRSPVPAVELLDSVPTGILVIDGDAIVRAVNGPAAEMVKGERSDLVGRPLYEMVHPDDLDFAADLVSGGTGFGSAVLGPIRIRYRALDGTTGNIEVWSRQLVDTGGWVLVLTEESTSSRLNDVTASVAAGDAIEVTMGVAVDACAAHPLRAQAAIIVCDGDRLRPATAWPFGSFVEADAAALIAETVDTMQAASHEIEAGGGTDAFVSLAAGAETVWTYPIIEQNAVVAVLVLVRDAPGPPTVNQDRHVARLVSVAELAFSQATHRRSLEQAATTDALTGIGNRLRLDELAASDVDFGAAIYIDLDGFKQVNDVRGHLIGDHVLRVAARRIVSAVRSDDVCVRIGGDEFVVVVAAHDEGDIEAIAVRLVAMLAQPFRVPDSPDPVTSVSASIGVCRRAQARSLSDGIARADAALLRAKAAGKNRWVACESDGVAPS